MALEQMKAELDGIGHALFDNNLVVPKYQRSYAWEEKNVLDLFQDLSNAIQKQEKEYFLGSVVVIQSNTGPLEVVDGQQRLATTSILLAAIRDHFFSINDTERASDLQRDYLVRRDFETQELLPKLRLNEVDHEFYENHILSSPDSVERQAVPTRESHKRIAKASELAKSYIETLIRTTNQPTDLLTTYVKYIVTSAKVIWVPVPDYTNAFTIFETLNDRGLALAVSDLLKNYLFSLSRYRIEEVQNRWITMISTLEAVDSEEIVATFIRHLWSSRNGLTRQKELYTKIRTGITSKQDAVSFATELSEGARLYAAILNSDHEIWGNYGTTAATNVATLNRLGLTQIRPLILAVLRNFSIKEASKTFQLMVNWGVRFLIVGGLGGGTDFAQKPKKTALLRQYGRTKERVFVRSWRHTRKLLLREGKGNTREGDRGYQRAY